jgi:hypothetical protein
MTDEQIWLLRFGRGWVDWWELEGVEDGIDPVFERLADAGKLETDANALRIKLRSKEEDESVRV